MTNVWNLKKGFILASASPDRLRLLKKTGFIPDKVQAAEINEEPVLKEPPKNYVARMAKEKALEVAKKNPNTFVLAADTIIAVGSRIVRKAKKEEEVLKTLNLLSGRKHSVFTAVCLVTPEQKVRLKVVKSGVQVKRLTVEDINVIIHSGEWKNVAGYSIEGLFSAFVRQISGSYCNIVGLPVFETAQLLRGHL